MSSATHGWIRLQGLDIDGVRLGIYPHEQGVERSIVADIALWAPIAPAARSEDIADAVDYDLIVEVARAVSRKRHYPLLEALCETLASALLERFAVERVALEITKPGATPSGSVSISIERCQ